MVSLPVLCGDFSGQGIDGLVGRDVLTRCVATFDGPARRFTLVFRTGGG